MASMAGPAEGEGPNWDAFSETPPRRSDDDVSEPYRDPTDVRVTMDALGWHVGVGLPNRSGRDDIAPMARPTGQAAHGTRARLPQEHGYGSQVLAVPAPATPSPPPTHRPPAATRPFGARLSNGRIHIHPDWFRHLEENRENISRASQPQQALYWHALRLLVQRAGVYWLKQGQYQGPGLQLLADQLARHRYRDVVHPFRTTPLSLATPPSIGHFDQTPRPTLMSKFDIMQQGKKFEEPMIYLPNSSTNGEGEGKYEKLFAVADRAMKINRFAPGKPEYGVFTMVDEGLEDDYYICLNTEMDQSHQGKRKAGESIWRWPLGRIRFYEEQGMKLPHEALAGPYHPTFSEAAPVNVNMALLGNIEYFPHLTKWPHYIKRLTNNGWASSNEIATFINRMWNVPDWLMVDRSRIYQQQQIAEKAFPSSEPFDDLTCATWTPPTTLKYADATLIDYYIIDLVSSIDEASLPTGDDEMALTMAIKIILSRPAWRFLKLSNLQYHLAALGITKRLKARKAMMGIQGSQLDRDAFQRHKDGLKEWRVAKAKAKP
ncbi:hypothetical protein P154DRAFT_539916 [Amniculicola lignicola CBS 123094]|uniref:Uncharacterized protein n=1 Tax=Amniculicola lignicola CBS 123094 TaxID=1392246 RepID=A0A6A5W8T5_9PLEO|nr:hypothetical protein P154DRAFT_539916 [Amniculicola lignicola CBS 123094]